MEAWASKQDTIEALTSIGFELYHERARNVFMDSPRKDEFGAIVQLRIYKCQNGYYCVDADDSWMAPVVWKGDRADYDKSNPLEEFVAFLDKQFPGWR